MFLSKAITGLKKQLSGTQGSASIILAVMVSGSVLTTIFHSAQNVQWSLSSSEQSSARWEDHFVQKQALTLASYLVSNNLILCKQAGWTDSPGSNDPLCKWNNRGTPPPPEDPQSTSGSAGSTSNGTTTSSGTTTDTTASSPANNYEGWTQMEPRQFELTKIEPLSPPPSQGESNQSQRQALRYRYKLVEDTVNFNRPVYLNISFDLVSKKESALETLVGINQTAVCRDKTTNQITTDKPTTTCPDGQTAEVISTQDADDYFVLIRAHIQCYKTSQDDDCTQKEMKAQKERLGHVPPMFAAMRRPLAYFTVQTLQDPVCPLSCANARTPNNNPGCRGDFEPIPDDQKSTYRVKVTNHGPGTIYKLVLSKRLENNSMCENNQGATVPKLANGDCPPNTTNIPPKDTRTGELISKRWDESTPHQQFLVPGEHIEFLDTIDCKDQVKYNFSQSTITVRANSRGWATTPGGTNVFAGWQSAGDPVLTNVNSDSSEFRHSTPVASLSYNLGDLNQSNDRTGDIEPKRSFFKNNEPDIQHTATTTTKRHQTTIYQIVPH